MTDTLTLNEDEALAGELALRVLSPSEEAAARAREASDAAFAADVETWNDRLARLAEEIAPVTPSQGLWPRIQAGLPANDNDRTAFWRRWALGSTGLLAASLAAVVVLAVSRDQPQVIQPPQAQPVEAQVVRVATLTLQEGGQAAMTLVYDPNTENLYLAPTDAMAGDERVPHLWLVMPEGGVQLVGSVDGSATSRRHLDALLAGRAGQANAVAVSMEAPGHTPAANKPDGPVVASGELQIL